MATLVRDEETRWLAAREQVGRDPSCSWRWQSRHASALHALLCWSRGSWTVRDLSSTNGTFVNGQRLPPGRDRALALGDRLAFGDPEQRWTVADLSPPGAVAVCGSQVRHSEDGVLALPDDAAPELLIAEQADGHSWVLESGNRRMLENGEVLMVGGDAWTLRLPVEVEPTGGVTNGGWLLERVQLSFTVSADEEHVEVRCACDGDYVDLGARVHNYLLLHLGRARLADRGAGVSPDEEGWRTVRELMADLKVTEQQLNLQIHRARRGVPALLASAPGGLIDRRVGSGSVRIAPTWIQIKAT